MEPSRLLDTFGNAKDFEAKSYVKVSDSSDDQEEVSISQIISGSCLTIEEEGNVSVKDTFCFRKLIILAVGNQENIYLPTKIEFEDALSVYRCVTKIIKSRELVDWVKQDNKAAEGVASHTFKWTQSGLFHCHAKQPVVSLRNCYIKEQYCLSEALADIQSSSTVRNNGHCGITREGIEKFKSYIHDSGLLPSNYARAVCKLYIPTTSPPNQVTSCSDQLGARYDNDAHILFFDHKKRNDLIIIEDDHITEVFNMKLI